MNKLMKVTIIFLISMIIGTSIAIVLNYFGYNFFDYIIPQWLKDAL